MVWFYFQMVDSHRVKEIILPSKPYGQKIYGPWQLHTPISIMRAWSIRALSNVSGDHQEEGPLR